MGTGLTRYYLTIRLRKDENLVNYFLSYLCRFFHADKNGLEHDLNLIERVYGKEYGDDDGKYGCCGGSRPPVYHPPVYFPPCPY